MERVEHFNNHGIKIMYELLNLVPEISLPFFKNTRRLNNNYGKMDIIIRYLLVVHARYSHYTRPSNDAFETSMVTHAENSHKYIICRIMEKP